MKLACEGCDWSTEAETAQDLHDAMMAHGEDTHANMFEGKSEDEINAMKQMMTAHVNQMIIDQN